MSAFTTSGHRLWRQHWDRSRYVPVVAGTADDSRVAISTLSHVPYAGVAADTTDEENPNFSLEQNVQVLETASGTAVKSVMVSPVVMSGQNFSLLPIAADWRCWPSTIQVYDLPPTSVEEQAKFSALKADVPWPLHVTQGKRRRS